VIDSSLLVQKLEMLETLSDIEIASTLLKESKRATDNTNPLDHNYRRLNTAIRPLDMNSSVAKAIVAYAKQSEHHYPTTGSQRLVVEQIYEIERFVWLTD
jgi:poly [ADP-ribose] polymerase 2/3/4